MVANRVVRVLIPAKALLPVRMIARRVCGHRALVAVLGNASRFSRTHIQSICKMGNCVQAFHVGKLALDPPTKRWTSVV